MDSPPPLHDLVQARRAFTATYEALAAAQPHANTVLRRRMLRLSVQIWWHPYWETTGGAVPAARMRVRELARIPTHPEDVAEP